MNEADNFDNLVVAAVPSATSVETSIKTKRDGHAARLRLYVAEVNGPGFEHAVRVEETSVAACVIALKHPVRDSRRRHATRVALNEILHICNDYTLDEKEVMRETLLACRDVPAFRSNIAAYKSNAMARTGQHAVRPAA